ncbi:hypothetical protein D3C80_1031330 [compost metagenome]
MRSFLFTLLQLLAQRHTCAQPQCQVEPPATGLVSGQPGAGVICGGCPDDARLLTLWVNLDPVDLVVQTCPELIVVQEQTAQGTAWYRAAQL